MEIIQNYRSVLLNSYPATIIKRGAIGIAAGLYHSLVSTNFVTDPICKSSTSALSNYLCLRPASFFDPNNLSRFFNPFKSFQNLTARVVEKIIPNLFSINSKYCNLISSIIGNPGNLHAEYMATIGSCCFMTPSQTIAASFAEELVFRVGIQKIALVSLAKFFPERIGKLLAQPISRIVFASLFFAFSHQRLKEGFVLSQFMGGLMYGFLYEKHGLFACTTAHSVANLAHLVLEKKAICDAALEKTLYSYIELLKSTTSQ